MPFPFDSLHQLHFPNVEQTYFCTILPQRGTSGRISEAKPARGNHHHHHHQHNSGNTDNNNNLDHHHFQNLEQESKEQLAPGQRVHPNVPAGQNTNKYCILRRKKNSLGTNFLANFGQKSDLNGLCGIGYWLYFVALG